jgi:hypothetical protein
VIRKLNDEVRRSVEKRLILDVEDLDMKPEVFDAMFAQYLKKQP